jgi:hypothetical protein
MSLHSQRNISALINKFEIKTHHQKIGGGGGHKTNGLEKLNNTRNYRHCPMNQRPAMSYGNGDVSYTADDDTEDGGIETMGEDGESENNEQLVVSRYSAYTRRESRQLTKTAFFLGRIGALLDMFARLPLPSLSLTGMGLCALVGIFMCPRTFGEIFLYPAFRLLFGTLYPAYASYKAVRTKNVKEYVSKWII